MDITLLLMQQLQKMTYTACHVHDFFSDQDKLTAGGRKHLLKRLPTLLEYLGYNYNFIGLIGPSTNLKDYLDFIHLQASKKLTYRKITKKLNTKQSSILKYLLPLLLQL